MNNIAANKDLILAGVKILGNYEGGEERAALVASKPNLTNREILEFLGKEYGYGGVYRTGFHYECLGGKTPQITVWANWEDERITIKGELLANLFREVFCKESEPQLKLF